MSSGSQDAGVKHYESDVGMARTQEAVRPLALKLAEHVLPFRGRQAPPFDLGHKRPLGIVRIRRDQVQFDVALPVWPGPRETRPAKVLKDCGGMVVDELLFLRRRVQLVQFCLPVGELQPHAGQYAAALNACQTLCLQSIMWATHNPQSATRTRQSRKGEKNHEGNGLTYDDTIADIYERLGQLIPGADGDIVPREGY